MPVSRSDSRLKALRVPAQKLASITSAWRVALDCMDIMKNLADVPDWYHCTPQLVSLMPILTLARWVVAEIPHLKLSQQNVVEGLLFLNAKTPCLGCEPHILQNARTAAGRKLFVFTRCNHLVYRFAL